MRDNVIRLCCDFLLSTNIDTLPIRLCDLVSLCRKLDYSVVSYSKGKLLYSDHPGIMTHFQQAKGFTLCSSEHNKHVIFYDDRLSTGERLFVLAHEIGHIVLKHNHVFMDCSGSDEQEQEAEADAFAYQLLAPLCILRRCDIKTVRRIASETLLGEERASHVSKLLSDETPQFREDELFAQFQRYIRKHTKTENTRYTSLSRDSLFFIAALCCLLAGTLLVQFVEKQPTRINAPVIGSDSSMNSIITQQQPVSEFKADELISDAATTIESNSEHTMSTVSPTSSIMPEQNLTPESRSIPESEMVYVTKDGDKFHKAGCQYIRDKEWLLELTPQQAIDAGYTTCKACYE